MPRLVVFLNKCDMVGDEELLELVEMEASHSGVGRCLVVIRLTAPHVWQVRELLSLHDFPGDGLLASRCTRCRVR